MSRAPEHVTRPGGAGVPDLGHLRGEIEQFLYEEAALLDEWRYDEWFELLADDIHYRAPTRSNRQSRYGGGDGIGGPEEAPLFDEDKAYLGIRLRRLASGMAWSEDPPSRTRRLITNVRVRSLEPGRVQARCNFLVYRSRLEHEVDIFVGTRTDVLRTAANRLGWEIVDRLILLDQSVITAKNISIFL